jgi:hypothetical protein
MNLVSLLNLGPLFWIPTLILAGLYVLGPWRQAASSPVTARARAITTGVRALLVALAVLLWQNLPGLDAADTAAGAPLVLVDVSASVLPAEAEIERWYETVINTHAPEGQERIYFGTRLEVGDKARPVTELRAQLGTDSTDLAGALAMASSLLQARGQLTRTVDVLTDLAVADESPADGGSPGALDPAAREELARLRALGATVRFFPVQPGAARISAALVHAPTNPVLELSCPTSLLVGDSPELLIRLEPSRSSPIELVASAGGKPSATRVDPEAPELVRLTLPGLEHPGLLTLELEARVSGKSFFQSRVLAVRPTLRALVGGPDAESVRWLLGRAANKLGETIQRSWTLEPLEPLTASRLEQTDLVVLADAAADDLSNLSPESSRLLTDYVRGGGGLMLVGGERSWGDAGLVSTPLETLLPVTLPPHGDAGDGLALLFVVDGSESFLRGGAAVQRTVSRVVDAFSRQLGTNGRISALAFADEAISISPDLACAEVDRRLSSLPRLLPWQSSSSALPGSRVAQALARLSSVASTREPTRVAREGLQLKTALEVAAAEARCHGELPFQRVVLIADESDLSAIGPQDWLPDQTPAERLEPVLDGFSRPELGLSVVGIASSKPTATLRPLQLPWSALAERVIERRGTADLIEAGMVPVVGELRQYRRPYVEASRPIDVRHWHPLAQGLWPREPASATDRPGESSAFARAQLRQGADMLLSFPPTETAGLREAEHVLLATWMPTFQGIPARGRVAGLTVPLARLPMEDARWTHLLTRVTRWLARSSGEMPELTLTREAGGVRVEARLDHPRPSALYVRAEGAPPVQLGVIAPGQFSGLVAGETGALELLTAADAGAGAGWRVIFSPEHLSAPAAEQFVNSAAAANSLQSGETPAFPADSTQASTRNTLVLLALILLCISADVLIRRQ